MVLEAGVGAAAALGGKEVFDKATEGSDAELMLLREIRDTLVTTMRFAQRQRWRTLEPYDLSAPVGVTNGQGRTVSLDGLRHGSHLLISGGTNGDAYELRVGTSVRIRFVMGTQDPKKIDLPILLSGQVQVRNITSLSDATWRAFLFVYSDTENLTQHYG